MKRKTFKDVLGGFFGQVLNQSCGQICFAVTGIISMGLLGEVLRNKMGTYCISLKDTLLLMETLFDGAFV